MKPLSTDRRVFLPRPNRHWLVWKLTGLCLLVIGLDVGPAVAWQQTADEPASAKNETRFFDNVRQITTSGLRSGEGYFSADQNRMVFQSERDPENPFYQMYLLTFDPPDIKRISPGRGRTTCGWIHPSGNLVMFSSTHEDPDAVEKQREELAKRESGTAGRYSWKYDPFYEIYAYDEANESFTNLTNIEGYDAEGSYSPDGSKIAFASNRRAYMDGEMSDRERAVFEKNPEALMDIYIMDADGGNVTRLTDEIAYDGGPFFSPDGTRICWRKFEEPDFAIAEVWTMNIDGTDKRQLTQMRATTFGPYYHPSGEYLVYQSNPDGFNFEVFLIPTEGRQEPVRVTWNEAFDGFPTFSADGKTFSWTSNRVGKLSQVFTADWNHEAALRAVGRAAAEIDEPAVDTGAAEKSGRSATGLTSPSFAGEDMLRHVDYLCRPEMEGRMTGSAGERRATAYVAAYLDSLGFAPAGDIDPETGQPTWYQNFEFPAGARLGENNRLTIGDIQAVVDQDWLPLGFSGSGAFEGKVSFAGYGIVAPKTETADEYDSFVHLDVTDKWVLVFRYLPEDITPQRRQELNFHSQLRIKAANVRDRGGRGLLVVNGPNSQAKQPLIPLATGNSMGRVSIPVISITDDVARQMMEAADQDLKWWQTQLDNGQPQIGFDFPGMEIDAEIDVIQKLGRGRNVVGRLQFGDTPSDQAVIAGAHIDHLGRGAAGSMSRDDEERSQVHWGADDNASGVAGLLEIAEYLATEKRNGKITAGRDLVVAAWSGEELGLVGSDWFVEQAQRGLAGKPDAPEEDLADVSLNPKFAAYLNMDMIGRFDEKLVLQGLGSSDWWSPQIEKNNLATGILLQPSLDTNLPTDATEFYQAGVPIIAAFTGTHEDYHTPRDTPEKLDYAMAARIARLMGLLTRNLVTTDEAPEYKKHDAEQQTMRMTLRVSLGTSPDYTADVTGTKLKSVRSKSPADKAGLQGGDVVIELAGFTIENVYDYSNAIAALKAGETVKMVVMRKDERLEIEITPE